MHRNGSWYSYWKAKVNQGGLHDPNGCQLNPDSVAENNWKYCYSPWMGCQSIVSLPPAVYHYDSFYTWVQDIVVPLIPLYHWDVSPSQDYPAVCHQSLFYPQVQYSPQWYCYFPWMRCQSIAGLPKRNVCSILHESICQL